MTNMKKTLLFLTILITSIHANNTLEVCTDNIDWAPYTYYERVFDGKKTNKFIGASVDALKAITKKTGLKFNINGYPWKRCLTSVENYGKVRKFEAFMDGSSNKSREEKYFKTEPFYKVTMAVFYIKENFPNGLSISTLKDLLPYKVCGIHGYNLERYTAIGINMETGSKNTSSMVKKLQANRCDLFIHELEPLMGDVLLGNVELPANIKYIQVNVNMENYFYFWISRQSPRAKEIKDSMDKAIKELKKEGKWEEIYKKHIPTGSGL